MIWMVFRSWWCQGTALWGVKCWAKLPYTAHSKEQIWSLQHATNAVGSDILGVPSFTTTPDTIHLLSCWACWPVSTNLESDSSHKNMRSCLSSSSGLPNYQFHQMQDKFKKLGKYSFAQIWYCGLASACHQLPATLFWEKDSKHQRLSSSWLRFF